MNEEQAEEIVALKRRLLEQQRRPDVLQLMGEIRHEQRLADELDVAADAQLEAHYRRNEAPLNKSLAEFYRRHEEIKQQLQEKERAHIGGLEKDSIN